MYEDLIIDPGHGGIDSGAVGPTGLKEKDINLKLALNVGKFLSLQGLAINYTRKTDTQLVSGNKVKDLETRAKLANDAKAKYFLSIHINSAENSAATGTETYAYKQGGEGEKLAKAVNDSLAAAIKLPNRGVKFTNFSVLRDTAMPAALTEVCFISNPKEEALLKDEAFLEKTAKAIALGFMDFIGKSYQESNPEHWAEKHYNSLIAKGIIINEKRFDDPITRGEVFALLDQIVK